MTQQEDHTRANFSSPISAVKETAVTKLPASELIQTSDNNGNVHSLATALMLSCLQSGPGGGWDSRSWSWVEGGGRGGGGGGGYIHNATLSHHSNSHIKIGSGVSHCNVSFTVNGKNRNSTMSKPQQKPRT